MAAKKGQVKAVRVKRDFLSRNPQGISGDAWYYENRKGIQIIAHIRGENSEHLHVETIEIPWKTLRPSIRRHIKTEAAYKAKRPTPSPRRAAK